MDTESTLETERTIARERSSEEARQTVLTSRMLIQSMILINGAGVVTVLGFFGARGEAEFRPAMLPIVVLLFCLGIFAAVFAGLYLRRTNQALAEFWELKSYPESNERQEAAGQHRRQVNRSKQWSTGLIVCSEICFLVASISLAISLM